ncbi:hypothetical protein SAMN05421678_103268 [Actinopolymorpha cephalotaxi]|uniref:Secreted protein n=1 Tax=Actinopolymorpha cephalotaxi TaxID=504797 RepID=A0A1I2NFR0_9ACTN|nr:hypothetical protein [Actinopolymorpha cephalotaxi]NYH85625.1 hypothetical protein [Actinopolymorpha cephalotaxi]SFG00326.1 hypothetical protein SAMN05421678_103268 [Actinopolymorpha cephalotaxi]
MNTTTRLGIFAGGLVIAFGAAYGAGRVVGPFAAEETSASAAHSTSPKPNADPMEGMSPDDDSATDHDEAAGGEDPAAGHDEAAGHEESSDAQEAEIPGGLMVSQHGYTLQRVSPDPVEGRNGEFAFRIVDSHGRPITAFDKVHDKRLHLIVVRRDLSLFRHVHPALGADGVWRIRLPFTAAGSYRAFADFTPTGGEATTLGIDVPVAGAYEPRALPQVRSVARVDGYEVTLSGDPRAGKSSLLTLTVERGGRPVTDLQPYLGAYGHLVALRAGDLAYLHVHPDGEPGDGKTAAGPRVAFHAEVPSAGAYRLYLDFRHGGRVHTAEFTVRAK